MHAGAVEAYAIDARPADCTMLALHGPLFQAGTIFLQANLASIPAASATFS